MRTIALTVSVAWGAFLVLLLLGATLDKATWLIVYSACALAVWLGWLVAARRKRPSGSRPVLMAIPLSILGPLWIVYAAGNALVRRESRRPRSADRREPLSEQRARPTPPESAEWAPQPPIRMQPVARPRRSIRPGRRLAAALVGSVLVFPVAGLACITLVVLGGAKWLTERDMRDIALISGFLAGGAVVASAAVWLGAGRQSSKTARLLGWVMIAAAGAVIAAATLTFTHGSAPKSLHPPSVSGRAAIGSLLTGHPGRWTAPGAPLTFDYQWQDCNHKCLDIPDATRVAYRPVGRDLGKRIRFSVTASPTTGGLLVFSSEWTYSKPTPPIVP